MGFDLKLGPKLLFRNGFGQVPGWFKSETISFATLILKLVFKKTPFARYFQDWSLEKP